MMVAVGSVKGSPGATTFALALGMCWPGGGVVLVEADPAGGDLGGRFGVPDVPGLTSLAVQARHGYGPGLVQEHAHRLPVGADVVIAPASARHARAVVTQLAEQPPRRSDVDVIVDVGRLEETSPARGLAAAADALLVVTRADVAGVDHTAAFTRQNPNPDLVSVVLVGDGRFGLRELAAVFGVPVAVQVPVDRRAAAVLAGAGRAGWGWTRVGLPAAARTLALRLEAEAGQGGRQLSDPPTLPAVEQAVAVEGGTR